MGWAIKRTNGSYRAWTRWTRDDTLEPGEAWEELAEAPLITTPPLTVEELEALAQHELDTQKLIKAVVIWVAQRASIPLAQARDQIVTIYKGL